MPHYHQFAEPLLRDVDAAEVLSCSRATPWRRVADGTIPPPIKFGGASRWPLSDIIGVIEKARAERAAARPKSAR